MPARSQAAGYRHLIAVRLRVTARHRAKTHFRAGLWTITGVSAGRTLVQPAHSTGRSAPYQRRKSSFSLSNLVWFSRAVLHASRRSPVPDAVPLRQLVFVCSGEGNMKLIFQLVMVVCCPLATLFALSSEARGWRFHASPETAPPPPAITTRQHNHQL